MPILRDIMRNDLSNPGHGFINRDRLNGKEISLLQSISPNERRRWRKFQRVPWQVLHLLWDWGICFETHPPTSGLAISNLLELLWGMHKSHADAKIRDFAYFIYEDTVKSEQHPDWRKNLPPRSV
jgi:hypothetical protein